MGAIFDSVITILSVLSLIHATYHLEASEPKQEFTFLPKSVLWNTHVCLSFKYTVTVKMYTNVHT